MEAYEDIGVAICLEDMPATPCQIADACFLYEDTEYMRDYVLEDSELREIHFRKLYPLTNLTMK